MPADACHPEMTRTAAASEAPAELSDGDCEVESLTALTATA